MPDNSTQAGFIKQYTGLGGELELIMVILKL